MGKHLKISLYLFLFGILAIVVALTRPEHKVNYTAQDVLGESTNLTLFVEPNDGRTPLLDQINASQQILLEVYLLSDSQIINALASNSGTVKIMLEERPFGGTGLNQKTKNILGNIINWTSASFPLTHQKSIVFDDRLVCVLNMNLSKAAFEKNREYNICSTEKEDIAEVTNIFNADWERKDYLPSDPHLVVSPNNSRGKLTALINSAQKTLDIEIEVLTDPQMVELLVQKAKTIPVRIILPPKKSIKNADVAGGQTKYLSSPYPHAKLIIVDSERAYVGSINFTSQSLDHNRELGILVSQPNILERLNQTFNADWQKATFPE